jgi:C1A family cysteine protease
MHVKGIIPIPDGNPAKGSHAICVIGYDDNTKLFKFKNSWVRNGEIKLMALIPG